MSNILKGDKVLYVEKHLAKVLNVVDSLIEIQFYDQNLIPAVMVVPDHTIRHVHVDMKTICPKCLVSWKKYPSLRFFYFDCPKCGAHREDYVD